MLKTIIANRYSARVWNFAKVEQEKIDYILECATNAPSRHSLYPWRLFVLGDSKKARKFKEWLFWNDTWCVNGKRADPKNTKSQNKRFNGQYRAPLLLLWAHRELGKDEHDTNNYWNSYQNFQQEQDLIDMTVSSSFAMLAAEEQGLKTCFGRCHSYQYSNTVLGLGDIRIGMALGIGYAEEDNDHKNYMIYPIKRKKRLEGYDTKNLSQTFPKKYHNIRRNKPNTEELIKFI